MNRTLIFVVISVLTIMWVIEASVLAEPASRVTAIKHKNTKSLDGRKSISKPKNLKLDLRTPKDTVEQKWKSYQQELDIEGITRSDLNPESQLDQMLRTFSKPKGLKFDVRTPKNVDVKVITPKDPVEQKWKSYQRELDIEGITRSDLNPESQVDYMLRTFF